ncbi:unnamed protein product [Calicophoron daubneyi]|uniref:Tetraspanin n=1 Tax=Calicophoron daubneyi TaxID=300641 RepID=A0AAV2T684_CALDB
MLVIFMNGANGLYCIFSALNMSDPKLCTSANLVRLVGNLLCLAIVILGAALIGAAAFIITMYEYMGEIFGREVFFGASYTILACGILTFVVGVIGFYDFTEENRFTTIITVAGLVCLTIAVVVSGALMFAYPRLMSSSVLNALTSSLPLYGQINLITEAWNTLQSYLRCCAINDFGWDDYKQTIWFNTTNKDIYESGVTVPISSPYYLAVPPSCCATLIDGVTGYATDTYRDVSRCQHWLFGPPLRKSGAHNDALYYRGCYIVLIEYMKMHTKYLFILTMICCGVFVLTFLILVCCKLIRPSKTKWN